MTDVFLRARYVPRYPLFTHLPALLHSYSSLLACECCPVAWPLARISETSSSGTYLHDSTTIPSVRSASHKVSQLRMRTCMPKNTSQGKQTSQKRTCMERNSPSTLVRGNCISFPSFQLLMRRLLYEPSLSTPATEASDPRLLAAFCLPFPHALVRAAIGNLRPRRRLQHSACPMT